MFLTFVIYHTFMCRNIHPTVPVILFVSCYGTPHVHFLVVSVSTTFFCTVCFVPPAGLRSLIRQTLSVLLADLIMTVVRELVESLESHGRQLNSEVGHMVRWATRVDSNRTQDDQSNQVSALHFIKKHNQLRE